MNQNEREKALKSQRGRSSKHAGAGAELLIRSRLVALGFLFIERIETGWRVQRVGGKIIGASPMAKVAGDWRAVGPNGVSVLVEVKLRSDRLRYSDFDIHQVLALSEHARAGGLSYVAWVHRYGIALVRWPHEGLTARKSLIAAADVRDYNNPF